MTDDTFAYGSCKRSRFPALAAWEFRCGLLVQDRTLRLSKGSTLMNVKVTNLHKAWHEILELEDPFPPCKHRTLVTRNKPWYECSECKEQIAVEHGKTKS